MKHHFELRESIHHPVLYGTIYEPQNIFGLVLFVHDVNESRLRYESVAELFNKHHQGFVTYDLRGHHKSLINNKKGHFGDDHGAGLLLEDVLDVTQYLKKRYPYTPITLMGQGVGAYLAMLAFDHQPNDYEHLILINPNSLPKFVRLKSGLLNIMTYRKPSLVKPHLHKWMGVTLEGKDQHQKYAFLSNKKKIIDEYVRDPFCGNQLTQRAIRDVLEIELAATGQNISPSAKETKISILGGKDDPLTHYGRDLVMLKNRFIQSGYGLTTLSILEGLKHDILLEIEDNPYLFQIISKLCFNL